MYCKACGAALPEGAHFCSACGAPVAVLPELTPDPEPPRAAPLSDLPEPTAPMYAPPEPEPCAEPVYAAPAAAISEREVDSIFNWGVAGLVCSFFIAILGIVFSAIAIGKARRMNASYGFLPQQARTGRSLGIAGLILSIVFTVLGILLVLLIIVGAAYAVRSGPFYFY